ncbi:triose-phosphate isomerase [Cobetia sp. L2A1]|uniref:triose-phosphate isomerase n=1 Tax=Cobetia sp. L2A1 TaxID=2686360 RepID=UPI00131C1A65|nr:triose-phosphate isomerase [Cobetia sp. L2A1]
MRTPLIAGNWKMNGDLALIDEFAGALKEMALPQGVQIALALPFPYLSVARERMPAAVMLGAQTLNPAGSGAFTGEVSGRMLKDVGASLVLVGHSERRSLYGEDDAAVLARVEAVLDVGLTPVLCIGETLEQREAGDTERVVLGQLEAVFSALSAEVRQRLVVAYEPVWAIGTGRTASPEQAQAVHAAIRTRLAGWSASLADTMQLLYGGSMKAANATELLAQPDIDGGLVGGASLQADEFLAICQSAG